MVNKLSVLLFFSFYCFCSVAAQVPDAKARKSYYGGVFTPKGDFKAIIVPVIFSNNPPANPKFKNSEFLDGWTLGSSSLLPDAVNTETGDCPSWLFNRPEHFDFYKDSLFFNDSKMFYHISNGQFRFMAELFKDSTGKPVAIEIDPDGGRDWSHNNKKAFDEMKRINPGFDWSSFDKRQNNPQYRFDNSIDPKPDSIVDYIIFIYRYSPAWAEQPTLGINRWVGSGGGYAAANGIGLETYNGYKFAQGFTMMWGSGVFVHELAHTLYNLPHLWGTNGTVGEYFYRPTVGWGATSSIGLFMVPSAWETWYLGYIEPMADIKEEADLSAGNTFELRDFCTTGDAIRIKIPFSGGQYLWLENHAKLHPFDEHAWAGKVIGVDTVAHVAAGVYAYIEHVADKQETIIPVLSPLCNGMKPLNADGNYDYDYIKEAPKKNAWGNNLYRFQRGKANPLSGTNPFFYYRADFNKNGLIDMDVNFNAAKNEGEAIMCEDIESDSFVVLYNCFGTYNEEKSKGYSRSPAFGPGDVLDIGSNPTITNYQRYDHKKQQMSAIYLNGLKITFLKAANSSNSVKVRVEFKQTALKNNVRWCGNITLPNITEDSLPDLLLEPGIELLLDKSGIVNRDKATENGDFINPTHFKIAAGATLQMKKRSRIIVEKGTILELEKGAELIMDKNAKIIVKPSAQLILNGNNIERHPKSKLIVTGLLKN